MPAKSAPTSPNVDRVAHEDKAAVLTSRVQLVTATTNEDLNNVNRILSTYRKIPLIHDRLHGNAWNGIERYFFYKDNFGEMLTAATARLLLIKPPYFCVITLIMSVFCIINI